MAVLPPFLARMREKKDGSETDRLTDGQTVGQTRLKAAQSREP